jgi:hypothetical protein
VAADPTLPMTKGVGEPLLLWKHSPPTHRRSSYDRLREEDDWSCEWSMHRAGQSSQSLLPTKRRARAERPSPPSSALSSRSMIIEALFEAGGRRGGSLKREKNRRESRKKREEKRVGNSRASEGDETAKGEWLA